MTRSQNVSFAHNLQPPQLQVMEDVILRKKLLIEAPVNGGRNYNGPKVAKFLVG